MATNLPKRPDALAQWSRAPMPADLASPSGPRRERFVDAVAEAMQRPMTVRDRRGAIQRRLAAFAAAAALVLMTTVGVVFARSAGVPLGARIAALFRAAPATAARDVRPASPAMFAPTAASSAPSPRGPDVDRGIDSPAQSPEGRPFEAPGRGRAHPVGAAPSDSELATQNRLFASAMNAREHGDAAGALRSLDELIRRYPAAPLAQDALVQRFRTLERTGDTGGAARAARSYLALYPNGFAREEARALALDATR